MQQEESLKEQRRDYRNLTRVERTGQVLSGTLLFIMLSERYNTDNRPTCIHKPKDYIQDETHFRVQTRRVYRFTRNTV